MRYISKEAYVRVSNTISEIKYVVDIHNFNYDNWYDDMGELMQEEFDGLYYEQIQMTFYAWVERIDRIHCESLHKGFLLALHKCMEDMYELSDYELCYNNIDRDDEDDDDVQYSKLLEELTNISNNIYENYLTALMDVIFLKDDVCIKLYPETYDIYNNSHTNSEFSKNLVELSFFYSYPGLGRGCGGTIYIHTRDIFKIHKGLLSLQNNKKSFFDFKETSMVQSDESCLRIYIKKFYDDYQVSVIMPDTLGKASVFYFDTINKFKFNKLVNKFSMWVSKYPVVK